MDAWEGKETKITRKYRKKVQKQLSDFIYTVFDSGLPYAFKVSEFNCFLFLTEVLDW